MCKRDKLEIVYSIARTLYDNSFEHGYPHVERVYKWSNKIVNAENLKVDHDELKTCVVLHDVGRFIGEPHSYYSGLVARMLLEEAECSDEFIEVVVKAIEAHSYSRMGRSPIDTELGRVLSDADKLDALGLIGFLRVFIYGDRRNRSTEESLRHFEEKILKLHELMHYDYSSELALKQTKRVKKLLKLLLEELGADQVSNTRTPEIRTTISDAHSNE